MSRLHFHGAVAAALFLTTALVPANAADMTFERALNADKEPQNWLLHHKNYQAHRFSQLKDINVDTVKNLKMAQILALGGLMSGGRYEHGNLEATPLVEDGVMYVPDGWGAVYAIDLTSGRKGVIKWKMDPGIDRAWAGDVACCGVNNRGVALWKDKVISISLDGRIFAINKATGEVVWERKIAEPAVGETITAAPLVIRDFAITGSAGGEFGIRGWIDATDLNTGKPAWRTHTIPGKGEPGNETWKDGKDRWKHGGASVWVTGTYDAQIDTFYQGIGNAGPDYDPEYRPGDNKWAASGLALSPVDGKIKWGFQYTPNDPYDFDEIAEHPIIDIMVDGQARKIISYAARNGFHYSLDAVNGSFIAGRQYVDKLTWSKGLDAKTGKPLEYDPSKDVQSYVANSAPSRARPKTDIKCPPTSGGKNWQPASYSPDLQMKFVTTIEGCNQLEMKVQDDFVDQGGAVKPRDRFTGGSGIYPEPIYGAIKAIHPVTGETLANTKLTYPNWSGTLATAGGVVFTGHMDGELTAYNAKDLKEIWSFNLGCGIMAPPITYAINGKQYLAVLSGPHWLRPKPAALKDTSPCSMLNVFTL